MCAETKMGDVDLAQTKTNVMRILSRRRHLSGAQLSPTGKSRDGSQWPGWGRAGRFTKRWLPTDTAKIIMFSSSRWKARWISTKKAAKAAGEKSVEMTPVSELLGCSAMSGYFAHWREKPFSTFFDSEVEKWETVMVSAGKIGWQVELAPAAPP